MSYNNPTPALYGFAELRRAGALKFKPYYKRFKDKPSECYFCGLDCYGILGFKDGSEVFSCVGCGLKHCDRKIRKKLKKLNNSLVKNKKVGISRGGFR